MLEKLRDEIIESQKARTDLLKWKLILVAVIGGAAFGIGSEIPQGKNPPYVLLGLVPLVCLYVDAICIHNEIRIMAIARFIRRGGLGSIQDNSIERKWEEYCRESRSQFSLEGFALLVTTLMLSTAIYAAGAGVFDALVPRASAGEPVLTTLMWSGGVGAAAGVVFDGVYRYQMKKLDTDAERQPRQKNR